MALKARIYRNKDGLYYLSVQYFDNQSCSGCIKPFDRIGELAEEHWRICQGFPVEAEVEFEPPKIPKGQVHNIYAIIEYGLLGPLSDGEQQEFWSVLKFLEGKGG